jgi:hypothetical protein
MDHIEEARFCHCGFAKVRRRRDLAVGFVVFGLLCELVRYALPF